MFLSSIRVQIRVAFRRREFQIAFAIACAYACFAFIYTLLEFRNTDISLIKDANQSVCFSQFNELWFFFSLIYPFLIVLPCATSFVEDYRNRLLPAYISRTSKRIYYLSKLFACLFSTALVIFIPFLMNIVLCNAFLPHNGNTWFGEYQMDNYCQQLLGTFWANTSKSLSNKPTFIQCLLFDYFFSIFRNPCSFYTGHFADIQKIYHCTFRSSLCAYSGLRRV